VSGAEKLCSFWERQQSIAQAERALGAFGYYPTVSADEATAAEEKQHAADLVDPACGICVACRASYDEHEPASCSMCGRGPLHSASETDDDGRCLSCSYLERSGAEA